MAFIGTLHNSVEAGVILFYASRMVDLGLTPYLSAVDFWHCQVWNFKFEEPDFFLVWTGFLQATQAVKIQFKLGKYPVRQTRNFKQENVKNQVQIDRGICF